MADGQVYYVTYYKADPGKSGEMFALQVEIATPVLAKLKEDGVLVNYSALRQIAGAGKWDSMLILELPDYGTLETFEAKWAQVVLEVHGKTVPEVYGPVIAISEVVNVEIYTALFPTAG